MRIMKKRRVILVIGFFMLLARNVFAGETNVQFAIGEWEPYTGEKIAGNGMAAELVTAACQAVGLHAEYQFFPWKRAEHNVLIGVNFGTFPYKEIQERSIDFVFSEPLFISTFGMLTLKKNTKTAGFKYSKAEDFAHLSVGIVSGTDAIKNPLEKAGVKVEGVPKADQNLKKLAAGRIDVYIDDKAVIIQALKQMYDAGQIAEFVFLEQDFGDKNEFKVMVSNKSHDSIKLTGKLNEGLQKIKESGEHAKILAKYGLEEPITVTH
jgi:polar amino acid transport system substrate-binding protein